MDKWAVATKRKPGWALYEDAAEVMAGECGWRSESLCMPPFFLNPITCATNLKPFVRLPKERPPRDCAGLALDKLEAERDGHVDGVHRGHGAPVAVGTDIVKAPGVVLKQGASTVTEDR